MTISVVRSRRKTSLTRIKESTEERDGNKEENWPVQKVSRFISFTVSSSLIILQRTSMGFKSNDQETSKFVNHARRGILETKLDTLPLRLKHILYKRRNGDTLSYIPLWQYMFLFVVLDIFWTRIPGPGHILRLVSPLSGS